MAPSPLQQRRTHNTLLFQKLLNLRDGASPFTLVLDTLEQSGGVVVREFARRAKISKSKIIYISYTTLRPKIPFEIDIYIKARSKSLSALRSEIVSRLPSSLPTTSATSNSRRYLLIIDTLTPLCTSHPTHISNFLSSLLISPQISLLATYHTDIPISTSSLTTAYHPNALTTLLYLSTAILSVSSLSHILAAKRARDKSVQEPAFGLLEKKEGVLFALTKVEAEGEEGVVVNMEIRRRSGRGVCEDFVLLPSKLTEITKSTATSQLSNIVLLDEHPLFAPPVIESHVHDHANSKEGEDDEEGTFSLHLTEKQKRDRDNIILPYFDAQKDGGLSGVGEGGRILYEMGAEDREDFDDEEDEI